MESGANFVSLLYFLKVELAASAFNILQFLICFFLLFLNFDCSIVLSSFEFE